MLQKQWPSISLIQFVLIVMNTLHPPSPLITPSNPQSWLCPKLLFITLPPPPHPNMSLHTKTKQAPPPSVVHTSTGRSLSPHANVHLLLRFGEKVSSQGNMSGVSGSRARSGGASCYMRSAAASGRRALSPGSRSHTLAAASCSHAATLSAAAHTCVNRGRETAVPIADRRCRAGSS